MLRSVPRRSLAKTRPDCGPRSTRLGTANSKQVSQEPMSKGAKKRLWLVSRLFAREQSSNQLETRNENRSESCDGSVGCVGESSTRSPRGRMNTVRRGRRLFAIPKPLTLAERVANASRVKSSWERIITHNATAREIRNYR